MISADQAGFFLDEGYLIIPDLLSPAEVGNCCEEVERLHQVAAGLSTRGELAGSSFQPEPHDRSEFPGDPGIPVLRKIEDTGTHSDLFKRLARHPRVVGIAQELLDSDDLLLFRSTLMLKPAFHGSAHALHQDSAYWPIDPPALVTVSIALTGSTPANGCFKIIPGSHKWALQNWGKIILRENEPLTERKDIPLESPIDVPLATGSALFFHSLLVHGSGPNRSPNPRNTALYAYFSPHVRYCPETGPAERSFPVVSGMNGSEEHTLIASARGRNESSGETDRDQW